MCNNFQDIQKIQKYLMNKNNPTKMFIGLLATIVNSSKHAKCIFLNNQQCIIHPNLFNLHANEYIGG